jgi:ATP-dependent Clp protease ATP-binding subunit ClpC
MSALPKFDLRAKNALAVAQQIAIQIGHNYIGSEHLLFGILSQPQEGLPFQVTFMDNLSNQELLEMIKKQGFERGGIASSKESKNSLLPEITEELQSCLDSAIKIAETHNYSYIGIEHLIFGILDTDKSHGQSLMNLNDQSNGKLRELLTSLFTSYSEGNKDGNIAETPEFGKKQKNGGGRKVGKDSALNFFTTNLNSKVKTEKSFFLVEREKEIDRIIQILTRKNKNNPILIGEPGVGKTALVEGLAKRINDGKVPDWLTDKQILSLDVGNLIAGSVFRGEFEQRIKAILDEVVERKNIILFIDELHTSIGAGGGGSNSGPDLSNILKPALGRGEISIIGATTEDEYRAVIKKDKAFERRFQKIRLEEPDQTQTMHIIKGIKPMYENFHNSTFPDELISHLVSLADRFLNDRNFPDKAIDLLDETLVRTRLNARQKNHSKSEEANWEDIEKQILSLIQQKNDAILNEDFESSNKLEKDQKNLENKLADLNIKNKEAQKRSIVTLSLLEKVVSEMSGVPLLRISSNIYLQIKNLEESLNNQIYGQKEATSEVTRALKRAYAGVNPNTGPIGSFLLLGPTGVGKTELVKVLTKELYGDPNKYLLKLDMSEFREKHQMSRLLGAPAGYVGYEDAPQLTEFLRKKPYSVILFDEIEKGHPENLNILLQMLEEGRVTDAKGNMVSCEHALIMMTSNLGKNELNRFASKLGFVQPNNKEEEDYKSLKLQVMGEVEKAIKPEILGRLTGKIVFRPISKDVLELIIRKEIFALQNHMLKQGRTITFEDSVIAYIADKSKETVEYGAREVKALVAQYLQDGLAEFLLDNAKVRNILINIVNKEIKYQAILKKLPIIKSDIKTKKIEKKTQKSQV